jgi:3-oxoacyl-(acyl-carrier-protein) synthase
MRARPEDTDDPVVVTGLGHVVVGPGDPPCDPMPYLKVKKLRKYMGVQDDLAVVAAARALESANLRPAPSASEGLGERVGLYLAVGYIPFDRADLDPLLAASLDTDGNFSMEAFSTAGFRTVNGLLTFRCLPNMPAYHVSTNFDIQGPYFVTYPGPGQFYIALEEALTALAEGSIDVALVGGVAHQRNFLVQSHFGRVEPPVAGDRLADAGGFLVLERAACAAGRGTMVKGELRDWEIRYYSHEPWEKTRIVHEWVECDLTDRLASWELGPAALPVMLGTAAEQKVCNAFHMLFSRGSLYCCSAWRLR